MAISDFDAQYAGYGIPSLNPQTYSALDSGAVTVSSTPHTTTLTMPNNADGTTITCKRGKVVIVLSALNASAVIGQIDIWVGDTVPVLEYVDSIPATASATAGQGMTIVRDIFISTLNAATIHTIVVRTNTTGNNNYTKEVRFLGERD